MADKVKQILSKPLQYADKIVQLADGAVSFRQDCYDLKSKCIKLADLLRQALRASGDLFERPTRRIMDEAETVLDKALTLVIKCTKTGIAGVFTIIPNGALKKINQQLENSIGDVSWLLRVSTPADDRDDEYLGLPPIAANEPILCLIWEQIKILCSGSIEERTDAAASLIRELDYRGRWFAAIVEHHSATALMEITAVAETHSTISQSRS